MIISHLVMMRFWAGASAAVSAIVPTERIAVNASRRSIGIKAEAREIQISMKARKSRIKR